MGSDVINEQLQRIASEIGEARPVQPVSVREFLRWFGAQRRGNWIVETIRGQLDTLGLQTVPDFESAYIDAPVTFAKKDDAVGQSVIVPVSGVEASTEVSSAEVPSKGTTSSLVSDDPTYRISKLPAANQDIVCVKPNASKAEAITLMMARDFSQLPVMTTDRDVKGIITWKSLAMNISTASGQPEARDIMVPAQEIRSDSSLFDAVPVIVAHDYVLVRAIDNRITGIITASDLSRQFLLTSEPFLLIGEIENLVRHIIAAKFSVQDMEMAKNPDDSHRVIVGASNLNFGEYIRLLDNDERWKKLGVPLDRGTFCRTLDRIREIRNDVVHFDPDGIVDADLNRLRECTSFLKQMRALIQKAP